jgi:ABC-2 type transport system ATP-binding protein
MIEVRNLHKTFGATTAVNGISFKVEMGEVLGFLGPNGAGKSTTMRMITGFIPPSEGEVFVGGVNMLENPLPAKRLIGYLPENAPSYTDMTVRGFLDFAAEIRGLHGDARKRAVTRVVDMCFLESVLHQSIDTLSKGFRHRTCFAQSIIHDPPVLVLDEPTDGLDPNQKHEVRTLIRRMGQNKAIVFSTHILEEVDAACSRAIIIDRGKIVANGTPDQLRRRSDQSGAVVVRLVGGDSELVVEKLSQLPMVGKCVALSAAPVTVRAYLKNHDTKGELSRAIGEVAMREHWTIDELHTEEGRLDEVFRSITRPEVKPVETT